MTVDNRSKQETLFQSGESLREKKKKNHSSRVWIAVSGEQPDVFFFFSAFIQHQTHDEAKSILDLSLVAFMDRF